MINPYKQAKSLCVLLLPFLCFLLSSCQGVERLEQKADIESKVVEHNRIEAEWRFLSERAENMESDLKRRQRFYEAMKGDFVGGFDMNGQEHSIRITMALSFPTYPAHRTRTLEEVAFDLNNLHLNAMVQIWEGSPTDNKTAFSCSFERIRPDLRSGEVHLISSSCPNTYHFFIAEGAKTSKNNNSITASQLVPQILEGKLTEVSHITGSMRLATSSLPILFLGKRPARE